MYSMIRNVLLFSVVSLLLSHPQARAQGTGQIANSPTNNLIELWYDGSVWNITDHGQPANTWVTSTPAATTWTEAGVPIRENVFYQGANGNLIEVRYDGSTWNVVDHGEPADTAVASQPAAVAWAEPGTLVRENVFYRGANGNLIELWYDGSAWNATDHGQPGGTAVESTPTAVAWTAPGKSIRMNVFFAGANGHLVELWYDGSVWNTTDHGQPGNTAVTSTPAVVAWTEPGKEIRMNVFYASSNSRLIELWYDGSIWNITDHGQPANIPVASAPAAVTWTEPGGSIRENVFYAGANGNLIELWYDGSVWNTTDHGQPRAASTPAGYPSAPTAVAWMEAGKPIRINVFYVGATVPQPLTVVGVNGQDDNGFLKNPIWGYQWNNNYQFPKVSNVCPDYNRAADWTTALATCTNDEISVDTQKTCAVPWSCNAGGACQPGHYNWFPVTYEGTIYWSDHSTGSTVFQFGGDDDYNVRIITDHGNLYTADNTTGVTGEFDSDETVDWWGKGCDANNDWWQCFHASVDDSDEAARAKMNGHDAIAIGLLSIDGNNYHAYNSAQSELHPIFGLMIHIKTSLTDDTWAFFIRNSGDQGYCGRSQHKLFTASEGQPQPLKFFIPLAGTTGLTFLPTTKVNKSTDLATAIEPITNVIPGQGATLTFNLSDPTQCDGDRAGCSWVEGELHINWTVPDPQSLRLGRIAQQPIVPTPTLDPSEGEATEGPVPEDVEAKYQSLSPASKELFKQRVQALVSPRPSIRMDVESLNSAIAIGRVMQGTGGRMTIMPDPIAAAKEQKWLDILNEVGSAH